MKAIIAGGGIGGLTAALALKAHSWDVQVLERAEAHGEVGAGLQISPNGWHVLDALGVTDALMATRVTPDDIRMLVGETGNPVFSIPLADHAVARWNAPYWHLHRADLLQGLAATLRQRAPDAVTFAASVTGYENAGQRVVAILSDGTRVEGDLLVGADGLHSAIRTQMLGPDAPRFTGNVAWRAVVPVDRLGPHAPPRSACIWAGPGKHAVTYLLRGGTHANFVGIVEEDDWREESWSARGDKSVLQQHFEMFHPTVRALVDHADVVHRWALLDRAPLPKWSDGRVALLGDAAHPMLPSLAQGAAMAIEDAWTLAAELASRTVDRSGSNSGANVDVPHALERYFRHRIARTSRVQATAARNVRLFHQRSTIGRALTYAPLRLAARLAPSLLQKQQDWLFGHDVVAADRHTD